MEYELFKIIYRIVKHYEEDMSDSIGYVDETEGQLDDFLNFIEEEYPSLRKYITSDNLREWTPNELVEYAEVLERTAVNENDNHEDFFFISIYIVANYLAKRRPDLIAGYYRKWASILVTLFRDDVYEEEESFSHIYADEFINEVFNSLDFIEFLAGYNISDSEVQALYNFLDDVAKQPVK